MALVLIIPQMRKKYNYLTSKQFPAYWPCTEMLKQHLKNAKRNTRKRAVRALALDDPDDAGSGANGSGAEGSDEDDEDTDNESGATGSTPMSNDLIP
jgi:hypothetical protein